MDFCMFMRKLDGKEETDEEAFNRTTEEARSFNVSRILRTVRAMGYPLEGMEERPDFPSGVATVWCRGLDQCSTMGVYDFDTMYFLKLLNILECGKRYSRGEQQDAVPEEAVSDGHDYGTTTSDHYRLPRVYGYNLCRGIPAVGSETRDTQPREELTGNGFRYSVFGDDIGFAGICEASGQQESRVSGLRNARPCGEPEQEDPWES